MEASFESFSIREYTARMRRVDASKCWPFDGDGRGSQLPPIECRRYRWWSSELQIARSADACERRTGDTEQACGVVSCATATVVPAADEVRGDERSLLTADGEPVARQAVLVLPAQASTIKEDDDGEEDGRQARSPGKAKVKAPKKRSILELFAVAPQIDAVEDESEADDDGKVLAVDKASMEDPEQDDLCKDVVEEPKKRKEESVETLMSKKIKKYCAKKNKENEEKMKKKTKMKKKKKKQKQKLLKKQKNSIKFGIAKKEKICKLRIQSSVEFAQLLQDSVIMKRLGKEIGVPVHAQGRKPTRTKCAPKENKLKAVQEFKLKKQLSEPKSFPIHSILKNQKTVGSTGLGKVHITDGSQNGDGHCVQQSEKHVHFSGKDDILEHGERHFSPLGSPQMQSLCKVFSDALAASSVMNKSPEAGNLSECSNRAQVVTANEDTASDCSDKGKTGESLPLQQSTDIHDVSNAAISTNSQGNHAENKAALDECVHLNNSVQVHNDLDQIDPCPTEPLLKVVNSSQPEGCDPQVLDDPGRKASGIDTDRGLPSGSATVIRITDAVRNSTSELAACSLLTDMVENKSKCQFYPAETHHKDVYTYDSQFQSSHLLKRDMMSTVYSTGSMRQLYHMDHFPESRLQANPADTFHDRNTSGNTVGLPLNSQGEYIHLQSRSQFGFDQIFKKQNMMVGPVSSFLAHNSIDPSFNNHTNVKGKVPLFSVSVENQKKCVPEKGFPRDQSIVMPISGFTELQDVSQTGFRNKDSMRNYDQFVSNLNVEANLFKVPCHQFQEQNISYSHNDRAMTEPEEASEPGFQSISQPTMRLMGKSFIVGRHENSKEHQSSGDSKIWADKRMMVDLHPALRMSEETIPKHWPGPEWATHLPPGTSYENLMHTLETQKKPNASNFYHLTVDPRSDNAHLDYGLGIISGNSCHSVSFSHGYKQDTFSHPHESWLSKVSMRKKNCGCESESLKMGFQAPLAVCNLENVCQHLLLNSTHCKHSQSLSHSTTSTFPPSSAFQDPDNGKYVQLPSAQGSSQRLPHWLLNAGQKRNTSNSFALSFPDPVSMPEPRMKSGTSMFALPSPPRTSIVPFPSLRQSSHVCFSDLPTPASLVHSSLYPPFPAAKSISTNDTCYWTMWNSRDDMKSKYPFLKSSDFSNKTRKRPAPCGNDFPTAMKRPNLCIEGDSGISMGSKKGEELHGCTEHISKMLELRSGDKTRVNDVEKDAHAPSTSKLDTGSRSRPVKLSAGAKHILKPSLNMDQDNSMPIHSTIPFARGTSSGKVPVSQKKPAKVYQF